MEPVNQVLNFETSDCKIIGGCDVFTTKAVASDRKLYKTIENHLDTILQESGNHNETSQNTPLDSENLLSGNASLQHTHRRDSNSLFWEQKRRMSVNEHGVNSSTSNITSTTFPIGTSKINEQNLKEVVFNYDTSGYTSSSSVESSSYSKGNFGRRHSTTTASSNQNVKSSSESNYNSQKPKMRRRSSLNESPSSIVIGPFGPINQPASRRKFAYLIAILNASYPDHDFSYLEPTDFTKKSIKSFISKFENSLISLGKQREEWIWEVINSHITLSDCVLYTYTPAQSFLDDEPGHLWSILGFFFNKKRKRVAFVYLIAKRRMERMDGLNFESFKPDPKRSLDDESEYDLVYEENAIADDEDEDPSI